MISEDTEFGFGGCGFLLVLGILNEGAVLFLHELGVDEVGFGGVEEVHDGQDVAAVSEALKAVRDCWKD